MDIATDLFNKYRQLVLYGVIGASGALLDLVVFLILFNVFNINPLIATAVSTSLGIVNNFFLNVMFNFKVRDRLHHRFLLFYLVGLSGLVLSVAIIYLLHDVSGVNANIAKILSIPIAVVVQYLVNSRLSFSNSLDELFVSLKTFLVRHWFDIALLVIALVTFCFSSFYMIATDDMDNMLSGKLILHGQLPYIDFFSHHMPGMYFLSSLIYPFTSGSVFTYRLIFNLVLFVLLVTAYRLISNRVSINSGRLFVVLAVLSHTIALNHIAVAESVLVYIFIISFVLIFYNKKQTYSLKDWVLLSLLLFCIPLFSLSYVFAATILYAVVLCQLLSSLSVIPKRHRLPHFSIRSLIILAPYLTFGIYLFATNSANKFIFDNLTFNSKYYAPMVGEEGGSILRFFINVFLNSVNQVTLVVQNIFNPSYTVQFLMLASFGLLATVFWLRKKPFYALSILLLPFFLDTRLNAFNVGAIDGKLEQYALGSIVFLGMALLCASLAIPTFLNRNDTMSHKYPVRQLIIPVVLLYLLVIPISLLKISAPHYGSVTSTNATENYYKYSASYRQNTPSNIVNSLLTSSDYAWVGPDGFQDMLYLQPRRATDYTFFFPWQYACTSCRAEFINDLSVQKPKIIYWDGFEYYGKPYYQEIHRFIDANYFTVKDQRLKGFYFIKADHTNLIQRLQYHDYEI